MAVAASLLLRQCLLFSYHHSTATSSSSLALTHLNTTRPPPPPSSVPTSLLCFRCAASGADGNAGKKVSSRLSQMQKILQESEERALSAGSEPTPRITLVNTKVDMRFNVINADWLSDRLKERILQMEKKRINKDGEIVISSTRTRTQQGNIQDALEKLQEIIDAAAYVPPPPSEEKKKKIVKLAQAAEQRRLQNKKAMSQKKANRRSRDDWD